MSETEKLPLVSIITPSYNSVQFIALAIKSVQEQTYTNWEMLITDDCSTDNTIEIIKRHIANDNRIKLFQQTSNLGSGPARNLSIQKASGKYIAFLDSDDIWAPKKLEIHVAFMRKHNAAFSHTSYGFIGENGEKIRNTFHVSKEPVTFRKALMRTEISCLTAMYDTTMVGKMFMPDIRRKQDYALWLSILKKGFCSLPLDEELAFYRQRKGSATNKKYKLIIKHFVFLRDTINLNTYQSAKYTLLWMWNGLIKYYI